MQLAFGFAEEAHFTPPCPRLCALASGYYMMGNSGVDEDGFQRLRVVESRQQGNMAVSHDRLWHTLVQQGVLSRVHRFPEVQPSACS